LNAKKRVRQIYPQVRAVVAKGSTELDGTEFPDRWYICKVAIEASELGSSLAEGETEEIAWENASNNI